MKQNIFVPGQDWLNVIGRKSPEEFANAFVERPVFEALILRSPQIGIDAISDYFDASRKLFEQIAFVQEARTPDRVFLEWEGRFEGTAISGVTVLSLVSDGRIAKIRIHHFPQERANAFAAALERRDRSS
jgi:hypothetical protein